ncbi:T9SS type A sorting domain-containing protein [Epilithonimonas sp. UC225_85]|uniref:T9SS type A sorting domain-containing protein n=1 Tax=Epilithonimonas sp. UC225_85 TaxID=3350167 RepID=UPI0036D2E756
MKRTLLFTAALLSTAAFSQTLDSDNFNSYTIGNLGTQGGWSRDGGAAAQAKVAEITVATYGRSLSLPRTTTASMWLYKDAFLTTPWVNRTSGNDVAVISSDFYTGTTAAATAASSFQLYADGTAYFMIGSVLYDHVAKAFGLTYTPDGDTATVTEPLATGVANNTWTPIVMYYNSVTGEIKVKIGTTMYGPFAGTVGKAPTEVDLYTGGGALTAGFDNYVASAVSAATLAVSDVSATGGVKIKIYPNPATEYINIEADSKIKTVKLVDASGKNVNISNSDLNKINVSNLEKGVYLLELQLENGTTTVKKFIKK